MRCGHTEMQLILVICPNCRVEHIKKDMGKFCSWDCVVEYDENDGMSRVEASHSQIKFCAWCGDEFNAVSRGTKYCSSECKKEVGRIRSELSEAENIRVRSREWIYRRDNFTCTYCGKNAIEDDIKLQIDHVFPLDKGGGNDIFNLTTSCSRCNAHKKAFMLKEDTIKKIWARNKAKQKDDLDYKEMVESFNKEYASRTKSEFEL